MIELEAVNKTIDGHPIISDVSLTLARKGMTAIIGPNGAGKSTLLELISRLQKPDSGRIRVDGMDVHQTDNSRLARTLAVLRQDNHLFSRLTVYDLVSFGRFPYSQGHLTPDDYHHVQQALHFLNLEDLGHRFLDQLSGGQRQRAFVAMVLCQDTPYVLLDEPLNNLDMRHAVDIMKRLRQAADELDKKIVLVLHDINFAACYADEILAIKDGRLFRQAPPEDMITAHQMEQLFGLSMSVHEIQGKPLSFYYL